MVRFIIFFIKTFQWKNRWSNLGCLGILCSRFIWKLNIFSKTQNSSFWEKFSFVKKVKLDVLSQYLLRHCAISAKNDLETLTKGNRLTFEPKWLWDVISPKLTCHGNRNNIFDFFLWKKIFLSFSKGLGHLTKTTNLGREDGHWLFKK